MAINHIDEHPHAFVRRSDNRVVQVAIFDGHDIDNVEGINAAVEGDTFVVCGCDAGVYPPLHSTWSGTEFVPADDEYLIEIGLLQPTNEVTE